MSDTVIIDGDFDMTDEIDGEGGTAFIVGGGTSDHRLLQHRDAEGQHPISSITDLQQELSVRPSSPLTNQDIQNILNM